MANNSGNCVKQMKMKSIAVPVLAIVGILLLVLGAVKGISFLKTAMLKPYTLAYIQESGRESDEQYEVGEKTLADGGEYVSSVNDWRLCVVNPNVALPQGYVPELTVADEQTEKMLQSEAAQAYQMMAEAALAEGISLVLCSGYRSVEYQQTLFDSCKQSYLDKGVEEAKAVQKAAQDVAVPGHSEHGTGLAADILSADHLILNEAFAETAAYEWLIQHCTQYGFVLRYPANKAVITGVVYQPWHFRYVGQENAAAMAENDLCLEEYAARIQLGAY